MTDNPLGAIEFFGFIGFVIWLFLWQQKPSRSSEERLSSDREASDLSDSKKPD